jgi:hypothetical protein
MPVTKGSVTRVYTQRQEDARINHVYPCLLEEESTLGTGVTGALSQEASFIFCVARTLCCAKRMFICMKFPFRNGSAGWGRLSSFVTETNNVFCFMRKLRRNEPDVLTAVRSRCEPRTHSLVTGVSWFLAWLGPLPENGAGIFLRNFQFHPFMKHEGSLSFSRDPANCPCSDPVESSLQSHAFLN